MWDSVFFCWQEISGSAVLILSILFLILLLPYGSAVLKLPEFPFKEVVSVFGSNTHFLAERSMRRLVPIFIAGLVQRKSVSLSPTVHCKSYLIYLYCEGCSNRWFIRANNVWATVWYTNVGREESAAEEPKPKHTHTHHVICWMTCSVSGVWPSSGWGRGRKN